MWFKWVLITIWTLSIVGSINDIGRPRQPITRQYAIVSTVVNGLLIALLLITWH